MESFTLEDGLLFEASGLPIHFTPVEANEFGISESSVFKAGESLGRSGEFCVDRDGYLVSVAPLSILFRSSKVKL